jgi:transaldolase
VCTIMVGRLDDWLKAFMEKDAIVTDPGHLEWAGVAVFKRAYRIYQSRGYRLRLLSAAFRNHMHWSELIGGEVVISPPPLWQRRFVASDIEVVPRIDQPVDEAIVEDLYRRFPDFRRAYDEDGMRVDEFDDFAPTRRTLRQFLGACGDLRQLARDVLLPDPDAR